MMTITTARLVELLENVPEKHLRIIDLTNQLTNKKGEFDFDLVQDMQAEINLARAEAVAYARATIAAREALEKLPPRYGGSL